MMPVNGIQISDSGLIVKRQFAINRLKIPGFGHRKPVFARLCAGKPACPNAGFRNKPLRGIPGL